MSMTSRSTATRPIPNRLFDMEYTFCISACEAPENKGGIYTFRLTEAGGIVPLSYLPLDRPMYTVKSRELIYVLTRRQFDEHSGVLAVKPQADGSLGINSAPQSTHGVVACHLSVVDEDIYAVNYLSGNVVKLPDGKTVAFSGHGTHPTRQEASHTHCVIPSPDKKYILVTDLGQDRIFVFDRALNKCSEASVPTGHGARHIVFSPNGQYLYCVNELAATVSVFAWEQDTGTLSLQNTFDSQVPADILAGNTAGAIRISANGKHLYISNRGEETLVVFKTEDGVHFELVQKVFCQGKHPRDFILTPDERFLICTNTNSNSVTVFAVQDGMIGEPTATICLPAPLCVTFLPEP